MKLVFLLEERSMQVLLDGILPKILPKGVAFLTVPHEGKKDLERSLSVKLRGWNEPDTVFVIVHDQDANDCVELKAKLSSLCRESGKQFLIRIACHELEAWYWGDLAAVRQAFGKDLSPWKRKKKFRDPDAIEHPKLELKRLLPSIGQIDGARRIAPFMDIEANTSHSFQVFVSGVRKLCG